MMAESTARSKRGPYKRYLKDPNFPIPKQTLSNWRKRDRELDTCTSSSSGTSQLPSPADNQPDDSEFCCAIASPAHYDATSPEMGTYDQSSDDETAPLGQSSDDESTTPQSPTPLDDPSDVTAYASDTAFEASSLAQNLLYPSAQISVATGTLLLHSLAVKHRLTQTALTDILQLLRLHMPANSSPLAYGSVHRLLNASSLKSHKEVVCTHVLCRDCGELISGASTSGSTMECVHSHVVQFYELQLDAQIQALFKGAIKLLSLCMYIIQLCTSTLMYKQRL